MEDMARLALVEESVRDIDKFRKLLYELLAHINHILENPHDYQLRTIKSNILKEVAKFDSFNDYLKYIGFQVVEDKFVYPNQSALSNLRMAQGAIERKINFCFGSIDNNHSRLKSSPSQPMSKINALQASVMKHVGYPHPTSNPFLQRIEQLFNQVLDYEDPELQALAREQIPIATLQLMALDRVREQQMQLKTGKIQGHDLSFDIALLVELLSWFKYKFFTWVDKPKCEKCGEPTTFIGSSSVTSERESCRVEMYKCTQCSGYTRFPRYNDPRTLLMTRRGRCGEWANCFALLCRAMGYDTRYVYDTTDHVWCEVFDFDSNTWLHVDPCEAKLNAPLIYSHGWGKQLSYVIAVSRDDLQDVTWRYTMDHKEVLKRRKECTEWELIDSIVTLRSLRQRDVSPARRLYLAKRCAQELVQLMVERKPSDYEADGRISGSLQWRQERGETGGSHTFFFDKPALYTIRYYSGTDKYRILRDGEELDPISSWAAGVHHCENISRKVEHDWGKVYLARAVGEAPGTITWKLSCESGLRAVSLSVRLISAVFETGQIQWTLGFDSERPSPVTLGESFTQLQREFTTVTLTGSLTGGLGDVSWQHAQLFRQAIEDNAPALEITAQVQRTEQ